MEIFNANCGIVIPIYKELPNKQEICSLLQVSKILAQFPIIFVCFKELNTKVYKDTLKDVNINYSFIYFDSFYFKSISGYNKLMLSKYFYSSFTKFDFILIYQLDAWVFKNELNFWCQKNYDYIGAPWFNENIDGTISFEGVGNGGLSLRKISSHIKALNSFSWVLKPKYLFYLFKNDFSLKGLLNFILNLTIRNNTFYLFNNFVENEDKFWGIISKKNFKWFKVAEIDDAKKFSIELFPSLLIKKNEDLPFGCHAWEKYDPSFWKRYINIK